MTRNSLPIIYLFYLFIFYFSIFFEPMPSVGFLFILFFFFFIFLFFFEPMPSVGYFLGDFAGHPTAGLQVEPDHDCVL